MPTVVEEIASQQAFPLNVRKRDDHGNAYSDDERGVTKREYFAALALQGILAHLQGYNDLTYKGAARDAVRHADALLEALAGVSDE